LFIGILSAWAAPLIRLQTPAASVLLTDSHGAFLAQIAERNEYGYWAVDKLPQRVVRATLALEDRRFWQHPGVDPLAVLRAAWQGGSGASTIAMQVARMQHPQPRTLWVKVIEAGTALGLTWRYGREAVLAQYLRLAPYSNSSHGIAQAARYYFDKPTADLSWAQIALLSAIPQAPARMNPYHPAGLARAIRRGQRVLDRLAADCVISEAELSLARAQLATIQLPPRPKRPPAIAAILRVADALHQQPAPAAAVLRTTLDLGLQAMVDHLLADHLVKWRGAGAQQAAAMVLRRRDRAVLVDIGSAGYATPNGAIDYARALRSPGSTLKPFLYALALDRGVLRPDEVMFDRPEGASGISNADGSFLGPLLPRQALANSRNVPAANLLRRLGLETGFAQLHDLGLHDLEGPADRFGLAMALGALPTSLERLVRAYAALADDGVFGALQWFADAKPAPVSRLISEASARQVTLFLADPMARLPSFPRYGESEFPFSVALKTGTSQGYRDAWIIAWSREHLVGVWVGRADAGPMQGLSGARAAGALAQDILLALHQANRSDLTADSFPVPSGREARELCTQNGRRNNGTCAENLTELVDDISPEVATPAETEIRLSIISPEPNTRIWRNPEVPDVANRLSLKAQTEPPVPQIVWLVDGSAVCTADPALPFYWKLTPGAHRFQIRLPFGDTVSRSVRVVID
jgi:penicillin-binding protein 1C